MDEPEVLSSDMLKCIHDEVVVSQMSGNVNDHIIACLEITALDDENVRHLGELLQRKRYAFECMRAVSFEFSDDFILIFYDSIITSLQLFNSETVGNNGITKLNEFMNSPSSLKEKLLLLQSFLTCICESDITFSLFEQFSPHYWRRKILLFALFSKNDALDIETIEMMTNTVEKLDEFFVVNGFHWNVDDFLEKMVCYPKLNVYFTLDVFIAIRLQPHIFYILGRDDVLFQEKINEIKYLSFLQHCSIADILTDIFFDSVQYILSFPLVSLRGIASNITSNNCEQIISFVELLRNSGFELKIRDDFLVSLNFEDDFDKLKSKLIFQIIKRVISTFFTCYISYKGKGVANKHDVGIECGCFDPLVKCKLHNTPECCSLLYSLNCLLANVMSHFTNEEIILDTVSTIVSMITNSKQIITLISALEVLEEYEVTLHESEFNNLFLNSTFDKCEHRVHQTVVESSFSGTYEKSLEQAIEEIESYNPGLTVNMVELLIKVTEAYENRSCVFPNGDCINTWSKSQIKAWASLVRLAPFTKVDEAEKLAVLKRLLKVTLGLRLRDIQMLVVIGIIKSNVGKGRLCQVNTGEGKTLIIAMVAAFKVLEGHKVDIYTSSPVLAVPQSLEFAEFFELCKMSVTNNIDPNSDYTCDVIYGTNGSFQRDVLYSEFRKTNIRKNRPFDVAIVDEVDNMLIDGNNWILKLTSDMPAMDHLETILAAIYIQVKTVASALIEKNGVVYFREEDESIEENGDLKSEVKYRDIPIEESKKDFIIRCTNSHIRKLIRDEKAKEGYPEVKIPNHLREIVTKKQLSSWIDSAIESIFNYTQDEDYILYKGKVTIVDANNTGVLKKNSTWCDGLHQFLQMKHGGRVEPESFTSNFISNVALFSRYSNIFGLTGTLGTKNTRTFLHETYDIDSVIIPPFKLKQHKVLKPIILADMESWLFKIAQNCIQKLNEGRSVLIIMNYIKGTEKLAKIFKEQFNYKSSKIKLYTTDDDLNVVETPMNPGDVIITTNIAGRGTDIKLNKTIEKNGGLHICLTFLPMNSRVEEQNIGRTSRNGNRGTSQLILHVPGSKSASIDDLKKFRSERETSQIKTAASTVKKIKLKDNIFKQFCDCLNEIQEDDLMVKESKLKSVEEQFAFWIKMYDDEFDNADSGILEKFEEFKQSILKDNRKGTLIKNPYFFVELGNNYMDKNKYSNAIAAYTDAINLDENFSENAYYNRAWAYLKHYGNSRYYIEEAIGDFKTARKLICDKENGLHLMQTASSSDVFSEQVMNKLSLYSIQKNVIEMAIGPDRASINDQIIELESHIKKTEDTKLKKNLISVRDKLKEDKTNIGVIGRALENNREIKIEPLSDDFIPKEDMKKCKHELEEFERNGWIMGFKVSEVKPIDWRSVIILLGIGFGQLIIGAAITIYSLGSGASIGMSLMAEGISDIITAVKDGIINRSFDWATWALMKVISLTVTIICAGMKAIKDVARTAYSGVKNVATSGMKAFNKMTSEGFKIAAKRLGFELSKGVAKDIVTELVNYGIDKSLIPLIQEAIIELVRGPIEDALSTNPKVISMLKLDVKNKNHAFENQIRAIGRKLLQPKENSKMKALAMHTVGCFTGNLGLGTIHKVLTILKGSVDFSTFTSEFITNLNKGIDKIEVKEEEEGASSESVIESQNEENLEEPKKHSNNSDDIDLNKVRSQDEQVQLNRKQCTPSELSSEFSGLVSTNMVQIMKGQIVSPITQTAVSYGIDSLSSKVHQSLETEKEKFRAGRRVCDDNNRKFENTRANNRTAETSEEHLAEVNALIDQLESGGPVTLFHLGALSKAADRPIEVYDHNGDLMFPVRNDQGGEPIKIQYHGQDNNIGHFTLLGKCEPFVLGSGDNMCAFNCIAQQSNKDPNQLKADTINILRNNQHVVASRLDDIKMVETAQNSVFSVKGGVHYYGKNYLDAMQYISSSEGKHGFGNKNAGHPEVHISYKGNPKVRLAMVSDAIGKKIIVKDKHNRELYTTGDHYGGDPIVFQYNVDKKDPAKSYFSVPGGTEKLYFHEGNDDKFYSYLGKETKKNPEDIKKTTNAKLDNLKVPQNAKCVENKPSTKVPPTGFFTKEDEGFMLDCVLKSKIFQTKQNQLNRYNASGRNGKNYTKAHLTIPVQDLNLPRDMIAGQWENGKLICRFPVKSVFVFVQHHDKHQNNPKAQVQIQTIYPMP